MSFLICLEEDTLLRKKIYYLQFFSKKPIDQFLVFKKTPKEFYESFKLLAVSYSAISLKHRQF